MLNLSYAHGGFPPRDITAVFLDEFRLMIYTPECTGNPPEFTLFDTFVSHSQDHPTNFRRFRVPRKYYNRSPSVTFDTCISLGTLNQDKPLIVDPTQAFALLGLSTDGVSTNAAIILRIQTLVELACLTGADTHIPWRELERGAIVIGSLTFNSGFYVQGVHVIEDTCYPAFPGLGGDDPIRFRVFDFSKWGCSVLRGVDGKIEQAAGGRVFPIEWSRRDALGSLGNGAFYCVVCGFRLWKVQEG